MAEPSWAYRCSLCGEVVRAGDVKSHLAAHKAAPDWPGVMSYERLDCTCFSYHPVECERCPVHPMGFGR